MKMFPVSQYSKGRSKAVNTESLINFYTEIQAPGAKDIIALFGRPGLIKRADIGDGPIRGCHVMNDVLYVVSGYEVYKVASNWSTTLLGTITGGGLVSMSDNSTQLAIAASNGSKWVATTTSVTAIADADLPNVYSVDYLDGYTIFSSDDGKFYVSNLLDATDIDPLDFATAESYPDGLLRVFVDHREIWMFGTKSIEVWYNAGTTNPPFSRFNDAILEKGLLSRFAVTKNDNTIFWVGSDKVIYRADGYAPRKISTHAVEHDIASWTEAEMFSFVMEGHTFVVATGRSTWVHDVSNGMWYKWKTVNKTSWIASCYANAYGYHVVGDNQEGKIYTLDLDTFTDNEETIRAEIELPVIHSNRDRAVMSSFEVDLESGIGLTTGQGSDPQIMMQYSDNGFIWSSELWRSMGKTGEYDKRAIWRQVGPTFRQRTIRLAITDPVKRVIISHYADIT